MATKREDQGRYTEQPFIGHLADAISLCGLAEQLPQSALARHGTLSRASVMTSAFCVEAAANALLAPLEAPKFLRDIADKMSVLEKFEFVLFAVRPEVSLDRGSRHIQEISELFDLRNQFVHAHARSRVVTHRDLGDGSIQISKKDPPTNQLGLPQSPEDWGAQHSVRVLRAVSDFLDHFVLDLCALKREELAPILLSRIALDSRAGLVLPGRHRHVLARAMERWPIAFRLLRLLTARDEGDESGPAEVLKLEARYS